MLKCPNEVHEHNVIHGDLSDVSRLLTPEIFNVIEGVPTYRGTFFSTRTTLHTSVTLGSQYSLSALPGPHPLQLQGHSGQGTLRIVLRNTSRSIHPTLRHRRRVIYIHLEALCSRCVIIFRLWRSDRNNIPSQILTGKQPYYNLTKRGVVPIENYLNSGKFWRWPKRHPAIKVDAFWEFIRSCWDLSPDNRPTAQDAAQNADRFLCGNYAVSPLLPEFSPFPDTMRFSMFLSNVPKTATHEELLDFIHRNHLDQYGEDGVDSPYGEDHICNLCPNFLFISTKGWACAHFKGDSLQEDWELNRNRAITDCSKQKWSVGELGSPSLLTRAWMAQDRLENGTGMMVRLTTWNLMYSS